MISLTRELAAKSGAGVSCRASRAGLPNDPADQGGDGGFTVERIRRVHDHSLLHCLPPAVFDSLDDLAARLDDPSLELTPEHVLMLRNIGPAVAGMPEADAIPIPKYLAQQGIRDMVRISDGRMSGTAYGTVVLHVTREAARGGPLALVRNGDLIRLDVPGKCLDLLVEPTALDARRNELSDLAPAPLPERGWRRLSTEHVTSATEGADLDFMPPPPHSAPLDSLKMPLHVLGNTAEACEVSGASLAHLRSAYQQGAHGSGGRALDHRPGHPHRQAGLALGSPPPRDRSR